MSNPTEKKPLVISPSPRNDELTSVEVKSFIKAKFRRIVDLENHRDEEIKSTHYMCSDPDKVNSFGQGDRMELKIRMKYNVKFHHLNAEIDSLLDTLASGIVASGCVLVRNVKS